MVKKKSKFFNKKKVKWDKWIIGNWVVILTIGLGLVLFLNRFSFVLNSPSFDFCIKENVRYWKSGFLQLVRSFLEHFTFNFVMPVLFVIFSLGLDKVVNKNFDWKWFFGLGAICALSITVLWEFQKRPVEVLEVCYDLAAIVISYLFIKWQLKRS
jgi:di/tricarboxylate transporter